MSNFLTSKSVLRYRELSSRDSTSHHSSFLHLTLAMQFQQQQYLHRLQQVLTSYYKRLALLARWNLSSLQWAATRFWCVSRTLATYSTRKATLCSSKSTSSVLLTVCLQLQMQTTYRLQQQLQSCHWLATSRTRQCHRTRSSGLQSTTQLLVAKHVRLSTQRTLSSSSSNALGCLVWHMKCLKRLHSCSDSCKYD